MRIAEVFGLKALTATPAVVEALQDRTANFTTRLGGTNVRMRAAFERSQAATFAWMYAHQPAVRTVVDKISENLSQLGLKFYERVSDTERRTAGDHPAALTMRYPNDYTPADAFINEFTADKLIYNNAYAIKFRRGPEFQTTLIRVPPYMVSVLGGGLVIDGYRVYRTDGTTFDVPTADMLHWRGYNPDDPRLGLSPMETLRLTLVEESVSQAASTDLATNGLQGGYIKRPLEAPEWNKEGKQRFVEGWRNARAARPRQTPVLEDGMEFVQTMISPKDAQMIEGRKFTLEVVAQTFGVPIELFTSEGDNKEARRAFYADTLAPTSKKLSSQLDHSIAQAEYRATGHYFEFDLNEKLRGDLENRFPAMTSAAGAPWITRNEVRAKENLPPIEGGDEIITPLNVLVGDNPRPAPNVMPPQNPNGPPQDGSYRELPEGQSLHANGKARPLLPRRAALTDRRAEDAGEFKRILESHADRQERVTKSSKAAKAVDDERFNSELADDLLRQARQTVSREGGIAAARMAQIFDMRRVANYLKAAARDIAENTNATTAKEIAKLGTAAAFEAAKGWRAEEGGRTLATTFFSFSAKEAINQTPSERMVSVSGGSCEECAPYQGTWRPDDLDSWPPYHGNCDCIAEPI